jgi:predicted aconitase with swiveling domain
MEIEIKGRGLIQGMAQGEALVTSQPISFLGGVDPETGVIIEKGHEIEGSNITKKILIFPHGKGSTVGSYTLFAMAKNGTKPAGIINHKTEPIIAAGCAIAEIPLIDNLEIDPIEQIKTGDFVIINSTDNLIKFIKMNN